MIENGRLDWATSGATPVDHEHQLPAPMVDEIERRSQAMTDAQRFWMH